MEDSLEIMTILDVTLWLEGKGFPAYILDAFRGKGGRGGG